LGVSADIFREHIAPDLRMVLINSKRIVPVAELERWLELNACKALDR